MIRYQIQLYHIIIIEHHKGSTINNQLLCEFSRPLVTVSMVVITVCNPLQRLCTFTVSHVSHVPGLITPITLPRCAGGVHYEAIS